MLQITIEATPKGEAHVLKISFLQHHTLALDLCKLCFGTDFISTFIFWR
jgi:hypothetical protein